MDAFSLCKSKNYQQLGCLLILLIFFGSGCKTDTEQNQDHFEGKLNGRKAMLCADSLLDQLWRYDIESSSFEDSALVINEYLQKLFEQVAKQDLVEELQDHFILNDHHFNYTISGDKKVAVCSWNSRMGESMVSYQSVVFYKLLSETKSAQLNHDELLYDSIYTISNARNEPVYLFHGSGTSSSVEFYSKVEAYSILKDSITALTIFPNNNFSLEYHWLQDSNEVDFKFEKEGLEILQPKIMEIGIVFNSLQFDGNEYRYSVFNEPIDFDFRLRENFYPENEYLFINGSELPVTRKLLDSRSSWTFQDRLSVHMQFGEEETTVELDMAGENYSFKMDDHLGLKGRINNYLFLSIEDASETWRLYIYDMNSRNFVLSIPLSDVVLIGNRIIYTQLTDPSEIENIESIQCDPETTDQKGYFKIYTLGFSKTIPSVEVVNHTFCSLIQ